MFLDGSDQGAIDFFRAELDKREQLAKERKELMVSMYNNVMSQSSNKKLTFDEFKDKHQKTALFSKRLIQQTFAVKTLQKIVAVNDYDGIDSAFSLYTLMKQERDITGVKFNVDSQTDNILQSSASKSLSSEETEQLAAIQARKAQLLKKVNGEDYQRLKELIEITNGQQLGEVADLDSKGLNRLLDIFHDMTYTDASQQIAALAVDDEPSKTKKATKGSKSKKAKNTSQSSTHKTQSLDDFTKTIQESNESTKTDWFQEFINKREQYLDESIA